MIVKVGGWLFIVGALLTPFSLALAPPLKGFLPMLATALSVVLWGSVGVGLLMRRNWARWLALGVTLMSWTIGSLSMLLFILPDLLRLIFAMPARKFMLLVVLAICVAIFAVLIVINFKLFFYLISDEGKFEFDTPDEETHAVLKSSGVFILLAIAAVMAEVPERKRIAKQSEAVEMVLRDQAAKREVAARAAQERENEAATLRALQLIEAERPIEIGRSPYGEADRQAGASNREMEESSVQTESGAPETRRILKCRDASGSVSYTQGYCPSGTAQVESRAGE